MYNQEIYDLCQEDILNYVRSTLSTRILLIVFSTLNYAGKKLESTSFNRATTSSIPTRKVSPSTRRPSLTEMVLMLFSTHESRRSVRIACAIRPKKKTRRVRLYLLKGMCQQILFFGATWPYLRDRLMLTEQPRSTGIAMNPFTQRVSDLLPNQVHKKVSTSPICVI